MGRGDTDRPLGPRSSENPRNLEAGTRLNPRVSPVHNLAENMKTLAEPHAGRESGAAMSTERPVAGANESSPDDAELDAGADLMARIRGGELGAFSELVDRYQRPVLNAVYKYSGNRAVAEELAQEVFVRVFRARSTYERKARFETWLYRIVFNLCANASEYAKRRRAVSLDQPVDDDASLAVGGTIAGTVPTPLQAMERGEVREQVRRAILRLPAQQRAALILSRYENKPHHEVSMVLGTSVEAVKSLLFRARENLRQMLLPYLREEVTDEP